SLACREHEVHVGETTGFEERHAGIAGITEHVVDPRFLQIADHQFRTVHTLGSIRRQPYSVAYTRSIRHKWRARSIELLSGLWELGVAGMPRGKKMPKARRTATTEGESGTRDLTLTAYSQLKELIKDGVLVPGSRITESDLSARLGMSRTPVREAIYRLEGEGLLTHEARRGLTVTL